MSKIFLILLVLSCFVLILLYLWTSSSLSFKERYIRPGENVVFLRVTRRTPKNIDNQYFLPTTHTARTKIENLLPHIHINHSLIAINHKSSLFFQTIFCLYSTQEHPKINTILMRILF